MDPDDYQAYLDQYSNGTFASLARLKVKKLSAAPRETTTVASFAVVWETSYGRMVLSQEGNKVTGKYDHYNGELSGMVNGKNLRGNWRQTALFFTDSGEMIFEMSDDGRSFSGRWRRGSSSSWTHNWTGTRQ